MKLAFIVADEPGQRALCHKALAAGCDLALVIVSANQLPARPARARRAFNGVGARTVGRPFQSSWRDLQARYDRSHPRWPDVPVVRVPEVNAPASGAALTQHEVDLTAVSGTNLVRRPLIERAGPAGMTNLHTGLSPYVKGGPNCTNWCLARGWFHLIGSTAMWIDTGVDSGNLIASERAPLSGRESLADLHWNVMEHAHELYVSVLTAIAQGVAVASVPQSQIGPGTTFRGAEWNPREMLRARIGFARGYGPDALAAGADRVRTIAPPGARSDLP